MIHKLTQDCSGWDGCHALCLCSNRDAWHSHKTFPIPWLKTLKHLMQQNRLDKCCKTSSSDILFSFVYPESPINMFANSGFHVSEYPEYDPFRYSRSAGQGVPLVSYAKDLADQNKQGAGLTKKDLVGRSLVVWKVEIICLAVEFGITILQNTLLCWVTGSPAHPFSGSLAHPSSGSLTHPFCCRKSFNIIHRETMSWFILF